MRISEHKIAWICIGERFHLVDILQNGLERVLSTNFNLARVFSKIFVKWVQFMENKYAYLLRILVVGFDFLGVNLCLAIVKLILVLFNLTGGNAISWECFAALNVSWLLSAMMFGMYSYSTVGTYDRIFDRTLRVVPSIFGFYTIYALERYDLQSSRISLLLFFLLLVTFFFVSRFYLMRACEYIFRKAKLQLKIAIVGSSETAIELAKFFEQKRSLYQFAGFIQDDFEISSVENDGEIGDEIGNFVEYAAQNDIREIYMTITEGDGQEVDRLQEVAEQKCVRVKFVPTERKMPILEGRYLMGRRVEYLNNLPVISLRAEPLENFDSRLKKRVFDVVLSLFVIIFILSWLVPIIALLIKLDSKGPVFFKQRRSGRNNGPFWCYKFRSMAVNKKSDSVQATRNDPRITRVGRILRKTSLDEFPQFFNVFVGNMSVVGPRPHMLKHTEQYSAIINNFMVRQFLKPGITGLAQVNGYRGETKDPVLMEKRVAHDIQYMETWSMKLDMQIIFGTVISIFKGNAAAY